MEGSSRDVLLAGALPGAAAGNSVSTETLLGALGPHCPVTLLTHEISAAPRARSVRNQHLRAISLGVLPLMVHGETAIAARLHRQVLRKFKCGWAVNSRYAGALRLAGIPYAVWEPTTLRDELVITNPGEIRRSRRGTGLGTLLHRALLPIDDRLTGRIYRDAVSLLAMSEYTAGRIRGQHPGLADRVQVLPHPPAPSFLAALARARARGEGRSGGDPHLSEAEAPVQLIFVGRVDDPRKNVGLLLEAYRALRTAGVRVLLRIVGPFDVGWRASLGIATDEGVQFVGRVSDDELVSQLLSSDILVVSSRQEGFGIVVAEAMHAGLPVVSTRCGGPEQVLRESGGGILVEHTARSLADAVASLATDRAQRNRTGNSGRAYAERELSAERFARRVSEEFARLYAAAGASGSK